MGPGYNKSDTRSYRKFGSAEFEGSVWTGETFNAYYHYKGSKKTERMFRDVHWREIMYSVYHRLNMSQVDLFKGVYEDMLQYPHNEQNSWESL